MKVKDQTPWGIREIEVPDVDPAEETCRAWCRRVVGNMRKRKARYEAQADPAFLRMQAKKAEGKAWTGLQADWLAKRAAIKADFPYPEKPAEMTYTRLEAVAAKLRFWKETEVDRINAFIERIVAEFPELDPDKV